MEDEGRTPQADRGAPRVWWHAGVVFVAAVTVRYAFLLELRQNSYLGNIRVSDAGTYYQLAQKFVEGSVAFEPYWQAPLYPLLLSLFQASFGDALYSVQWLHIVIGAANCALVFRLTEGLFGSRAAWVAGSVAVFYAPFWIFDVQPLPANVTALLYLLLASAYLRFREQGRVLWLAVAGLLLGLSIATHGLAIFALALFLFDLASRHKQAGQQRKVLLAVLLVTTMLVPTLVSLRNSLAAGTPMFVSYNAGINLFIGNHRDLEETLGRRGGYEWGELFRAPYQSGAKEPGQLNRYFVGRAIDEWLEAPGALLLTTGQKLLMAFGANETKRNFPIYPLREDSALLRLLLFEVSLGDLVLFAFPGGLILPLALLGLFQVGRGDLRSRLPRERALLAGKLALVHLLGMIVFFPTARYRLPALVVLFPYMGVMVVYLYDQLRRLAVRAGDARMVLSRGAVPVLVLFVALNVGAANVFRHPVEDRAEDLYFGALWDYQRLQRVNSVFLSRRLLAQVEEATRIDPDYPEPVGLVAIYYLYRDIEQSLAYFARLGELVPNDRDVLQQIREAQAIRDAGK